MKIAQAPAPAFTEQKFLAGTIKIGDECGFVFLKNLCAHGYGHDHIIRAFAVALLAHTVLAVFGFEVLLVAEINEGIKPRGRADNDTAAAPAITAIRPAFGDEFLTPERDAAGPAIAGFYKDFCFIEEFHNEPEALS